MKPRHFLHTSVTAVVLAYSQYALQAQGTPKLETPTARAQKPNIVLILSDDHSYPYLGSYGYEGLNTPSFDRFAGEGLKFRRAFTTSPQCVPSRASIMTGRSPVASRITRFSSPLPREEITFPELLRRDAGYFTGVLGRSYHLDGGNAPEVTERVFKARNLRTFKERMDYVDSSGQPNVAARMNEFFDKRPAGKPFFLWVNFSDPHHPWTTRAQTPGANAPDPARIKVPGHLPDLPGVRTDLSRYLGEIEHMDKDFQRVLDILQQRGAGDNTLILFMGDNGMALPRGKGSLHEAGCNVPLLARWPGVIKANGDSRVLISGEDIAPTCLQAAGMPVPERMSGLSFLPLLRDEAFAGRQYLFAERGPHGSATFNTGSTSSGVDYSRMVRTSTHKLIYNVTPHMRYTPVDSGRDPGWQQMAQAHTDGKLAAPFAQIYFGERPVYEVYDLDKDPGELRNLAGQAEVAGIERELKEALQEKMILDYDYLPLPIPPAPRNNSRNASELQNSASQDIDRSTLFTQKDTNRDEKLSRVEFLVGRKPNEAELWFKARDTNGDGFLNLAEFLANVARPTGLK